MRVSEIRVKFKKLHPKAVEPVYKTVGAAGADLSSIEEIIIPPRAVRTIRTGLVVALPDTGYELQIRSRSGLAVRGVCVFNAPGTIDEDYRGEILVILYNSTCDGFKITEGMRIAQAVLARVDQAKYEEVDELGVTARGEKGFGSTGET